MIKQKLMMAIFLLMLALPFAATQADGIMDFIQSQLDGKGTVSNVDLANRTIVIDDRLYQLSRTVTVFDTTVRKPVSLSGINMNDVIGFKSRALREPTKPYNQLITKIWILNSN